MDAATLRARKVLKVLMYMLDKMSGVQFRRYSLALAGASEPARVPGAMDKGCDYIIKNLPRHTENLA
eukprot:6350136-Alexandrium_andersonii.AAC.1